MCRSSHPVKWALNTSPPASVATVMTVATLPPAIFRSSLNSGSESFQFTFWRGKWVQAKFQAPTQPLFKGGRKSLYWELQQKLQTTATCTLASSTVPAPVLSEFQIGTWGCPYPAAIVLNVQQLEVAMYDPGLKQSPKVYVTGGWATSLVRSWLTLLIGTHVWWTVVIILNCNQVILYSIEILRMLYEPFLYSNYDSCHLYITAVTWEGTLL